MQIDGVLSSGTQFSLEFVINFTAIHQLVQVSFHNSCPPCIDDIDVIKIFLFLNADYAKKNVRHVNVTVFFFAAIIKQSPFFLV